MKKLFIIVLLFLNTSLKAQYSALTVFPDEHSFLCSYENIDDNNFGFQIGGYYQIGSTSTTYIYRTPYSYLNRLGVNYGFAHCGFVLGLGVKIDLMSGPDANFYPDATLKFQPLKLLTKNKDIWDISVSYNISDKQFIGFGISIPFRYGSYYR